MEQNINSQLKRAGVMDTRLARIFNAVKQVPCKVSDFLDDRIPAMNAGNFDAETIQNSPKGIRNDKEMEGAWRFLQFILNRSGLPQMEPFEIIQNYRFMNEAGLGQKKLAKLRKQIKEAKRAGKKDEAEKLKEEMTAFSKTITSFCDYSHVQRSAITQAALIVGFIKEYVSVRSLKIENAEESPVFIPCIDAEGLSEVGADWIMFNKEERILQIPKGEHTFYANMADARNSLPRYATHVIPVLKKLFTREIRVGEDRDDHITVKIQEQLKIGYMETNPVSVAEFTQIIENSKPTNDPLLSKSDLEKEQTVEGTVVE